MERGVVKWYSEEKGYGFIKSNIGDKDYFVHNSEIKDLERSLEPGEFVEFEVSQGKKGLEARNVRLIIDPDTVT